MRRLLQVLNRPDLIGTWAAHPALQVPVKELVLASRAQAEEATGYRVGTIGPFALKMHVPIVVDRDLVDAFDFGLSFSRSLSRSLSVTYSLSLSLSLSLSHTHTHHLISK
jgi:hypothetical protein